MVERRYSLEIEVDLAKDLPEEGKMTHTVYSMRKRRIYLIDRHHHGLSSFVRKGRYRIHFTHSRTHGKYITLFDEVRNEGFLLPDTTEMLAELCRVFGPDGSVANWAIYSMILESNRSKEPVYITFL